MKRLFFIFLLGFAVVFSVFSQNWFIGAGVNLDFNKTSDTVNDGVDVVEMEYDGITFRISPEIGYKINNISLGINPFYQINERNTEQDSNSSSLSSFGLGIGLFLRYNFVTLFDRLSILGRINLDYMFSGQDSFSTSQSEVSSRGHRVSLSIRPVIEFKVSDSFSVYSSIIGNIASIGYEYTSMNSTGNNGNEYSNNWHNLLFSLPSVHNFSLTDISMGFYITF